jgi:hypothetical protein
LKPYERTGLGRPIDLRYPSNRLVVIGSFLAFFGATAVEWIDSGAVDILFGVSAAIGVFLSWAVARELDPDRPGAAALAMPIALVLTFVAPGAIGLAGVVLLAVRILAGTIGRSLRAGDVVLLLLVAGYAGSRPESWAAGAVLIAAAVVSRFKWPVRLAAALAAAAIGTAIVDSATPVFEAPSAVALGLAAAGVAAAILAAPVSSVAAKTDFGSQSIIPGRIAAARLAAGFAVAGVLLGGTVAPVALAPVVAALGAVALFRIPVRRFQRGADRLPSRQPASRSEPNASVS